MSSKINGAVQMNGGVYSFRVTANGGTVDVGYKDLEDDAFQPLLNGSFSADSDGVMTLGKGSWLEVTTTGSAQFTISRL